MLEILLIFLLSLAFSIIIGFIVFYFSKNFHLSQTILHYVDKHAGKSGTPTMGGMTFIFATIFSVLCFLKEDYLFSIFLLVVMFAYGILGFLDDFIKIKFHKNEGLKPYQKIIGQFGIAIIISVFVYLNIGSQLDLFGVKIDLGIFIIPFIIIFYLAVTNAVNLLDGLDGLASGVSAIYLIFFGSILALLGFESYSLFSFALVGALIGFLLFNCFPAKIFMGDTGSLALGGAIATLAVFSGLELVLVIIGIMYVLTALSDILQVAYYKKTHKRIFKMAPLHHHFEQNGVHENRIVTIYIVITIICGISALIGYVVVTGAV